MDYSEIEGIKDVTLDDAVEQLADVRKQLKTLQEVEWVLYTEVVRQMDDIGATESRVEIGKVALTRPVSYDYSVLAGLREITDPEDLEGAYTPPHEEVQHIQESWNMTKAKPLKKLSHQHGSIIEDAKIFGRPKITIEENGNNGNDS
tara:strand:+ start:708 stop:1148 length:441 start_codon:yes stop_codon:yes gene_type:complete